MVHHNIEDLCSLLLIVVLSIVRVVLKLKLTFVQSVQLAQESHMIKKNPTVLRHLTIQAGHPMTR